MGLLDFRNPGQEGIDPQFRQILEGVAGDFGGLGITSGFRSPEHNKKVGGAKSSRHVHGTAADIDLSGLDSSQRSKLTQRLIDQGAKGFITYSNSPNMMHVDMGIPGVRPNLHFMHDRSARNIANAPEWLRNIASQKQGQAPVSASPAAVSTQGAPTMTPFNPAVQQEKAPKGLLGQYLTPDRRDRLTLALEGMTLNPNQGLQQAALAGIQGRAEDRRVTKAAEQAAAQQQQQATRTAEWLQKNGRTDLAEALMSGAMDPKTALNEALRPTKNDATAMQKNFEFLVSQGIPKERALEMARGGQTINVGGDQNMGTIPPGFSVVPDPSNASGFRMEAIPGGPKDTSEADSAGSLAAQDSLDLIDSVIADPALPGITGMLEGRLPPLSQSRTDLNVKVEQIKGQAFLSAFERLKGAGAITEREGAAATAAMARLDRAQSTKAFTKALKELRGILARGVERSSALDTQSPDLSDEDLFKQYGID